MIGKNIGYIRVSTLDQNIDRQLDKIQLDKIFTDRASGKNTGRPQFQAMLEFVREGDSLYVHSMDRLARNLKDLLDTVNFLTSKNISIFFVTENLKFTTDDDPMGHLMLSILGAYAEFERKMSRKTQAEGIEKAKRKGKYKGRKPALNSEQIEALKKRALDGETVANLARDFDITRPTVYKYLKR